MLCERENDTPGTERMRRCRGGGRGQPLPRPSLGSRISCAFVLFSSLITQCLLHPELQAIQTRGVEQGEGATVRNSHRGHAMLCKAARQLLSSKLGTAVYVHFFGASLLPVQASTDREIGINVTSVGCSADPVVQITHPALTALV